MAEITDVIFSSDTFGNINVHDLKSGTTLMTYKSSAINRGCLDILQNDYVLAVEKGPLILAWPINSQEKLQSIRMLCPGVVNCFAISPDGLYIAVSIENKLLVWQISTGKLLSTVIGHYQHITVIKWTPDGSDIITGGEDGLVCVWKLSQLISSNYMYMGIRSDNTWKSQTDPRYTFSDHSIRINDLFIGNGGLRARLYTASADKTCKIYDLATGHLLLSIVFDVKPCSIVVDPLETIVFIGSGDGTIKTFYLLDPPRSKEYHLEESNNNTTFLGHTKQVNCLSVSLDGITLISGSSDETIKVWHIESKQCLKTIRTRGNVTNVIIRLLPKQLQMHDFQPTTVLKNFQKRYDNENIQIMEVCNPVDIEDYSEEEILENNAEDVSALREKINELEAVNKELLNFAAKKILNREDQIVKNTPKKKIVEVVSAKVEIKKKRRKRKK